MTASSVEEPLKAKVVKVGEETKEKIGKERYTFGFANNYQLLWCLDLITGVGKFIWVYWKILWVYWQDIKVRLTLRNFYEVFKVFTFGVRNTALLTIFIIIIKEKYYWLLVYFK